MNIKFFIIILFLINIFILSSCVGTLGRIARSNKAYINLSDNSEKFSKPFGATTFSAIKYDNYLISGKAPWSPFPDETIGYISYPLDLCFDVIFLPFDLIFWSFGWRVDDGRFYQNEQYRLQ